MDAGRNLGGHMGIGDDIGRKRPTASRAGRESQGKLPTKAGANGDRNTRYHAARQRRERVREVSFD